MSVGNTVQIPMIALQVRLALYVRSIDWWGEGFPGRENENLQRGEVVKAKLKASCSG